MGDLAKRLAFLSSANSDGLDNPMAVDSVPESDVDNLEPWKREPDQDPWEGEGAQNNFSFFGMIDEEYGRKGKKKRKSGFVEDLAKRHDQLQNFSADAMADSLDSYLDELDEGDAELRDSLISMGRKYHRDTSTSAKTSEIAKAYSAAEKKLRALHAEIADDKAALQKDIDQMRLARTRNFKALSEMVETRNSMHNTQLSILKEINRMRKDEFDLRQKEAKAAKEEQGDADSVNSNTLRSLFSIGRGNMVNAMGGYEGISGATVSDDSGAPVYSDYNEPPEGIEESIENDRDENYDDRFLNFEGMGVQFVLLIDEDDKPVDLIAEDKNGNQVYDYPFPTDWTQLNFNINRRMMTATDDYHRNYKLREI